MSCFAQELLSLVLTTLGNMLAKGWDFFINDMYSLASLRLQLRFKSFSGFDVAENLGSS